MKKQIAYFTGTYPSLTETFVQREIDYLKKYDIDVTVFAIRRPNDLQEASVRAERSKDTIYARPDHVLVGIVLQILYLLSRPVRYLKIIKLILGQVKNHPLPVVATFFSHLFSAVVFLDYLRKKRIHHIHAHFATASTMALFCHYLDDISFSFTVHASGDIYSDPIMLNEKMTAAAMVISDSEYNLAYLNLVTDYQFESKIHIVYNGVEVPDNFTYKSAQDRTIKMISVGGLKYFKGFPTLIQALSLLRDRGYAFHCSIIGDGPQRRVLETLISRGNLSGYITLHGNMEHAQTLQAISAADIFILASEIYLSGFRDGMPTVLTETMALGVPVVSTYVSCIPDLVENGKSGILIPEKKPDLLVQAIAVLIDDPDLRYNIAKGGYNRVKEKFNVVDSREKLMKLLSRYL
jgi:glycosyltransferase involved in cell wall biosynthesis